MTRRRHPLNGDHIGGVTHEFAGLFREIGDCIKCSGHLLVEPVEHLFLGPEEVRIALHLFEIGAGDAAGVGEEIRNDEDSPFLEHRIGLRSRRTICALGDDPGLGVDTTDVVTGDLVLERRRNENLCFLIEPGVALENLRNRLPQPSPCELCQNDR